MNLQKFEKAGKWLFGISVLVGIVLCSGTELLPLLIGIIFLAATLAFPGFRRRIHLPRIIIFSVCAMAILLLAFYWGVIRDEEAFSDTCSWLLWPLENSFASAESPPLLYWLPLWVVKGLLFGLSLEALFLLGREAVIRRERPAEENGPPFGLAGLACLMCVPISYLAAKPLTVYLNPRLDEWVLPLILVIGPLSAAFLILYQSSWHRELPGNRRVVSIALRSGVIFGIVLIIVALMLLAVVVLQAFPANPVCRGQYGSL